MVHLCREYPRKEGKAQVFCDAVDRVDAVDKVHTVDRVYTVDKVYTVDNL
jgi:hypothetical protein